MCYTHPLEQCWSLGGCGRAVTGTGGNSWWLSLPLALWGRSGSLHDCGSQCEVLCPSGQAWLSLLPLSWMGLSLLGAALGIFPYPDLSLEGQLWSIAGNWNTAAELEHQGWPRKAGSMGGLDAAPSGTSSLAVLPACLPHPCPHCPLVAHVNRVWCEAASEGLHGEHPKPHSARVSQCYGIVRTNPGTDAKPLGEELVPALPYLSELEFGMFTSVYIAQPFPGRKGELHGAIAIPLLC